jgi:hypothetical protein
VNGFYKINPCLHDDLFNAHEVRFACEQNRYLTIQDEMCLAHGQQEIIDYINNSVALGEIGRLSPLCFAT